MYTLEEVEKNDFLKASFSQSAEKKNMTLQKYIEERNEREKETKIQIKEAQEVNIKFKCSVCGEKWVKKGKDLTEYPESHGEALRILDKAKDINKALCRKCYVSKKIIGFIPPKFHNLVVIPEKEKTLLDSWNKNLFITGSVGTGKTVFACAIGRKRLENNEEFKFLSYPSFIMKLQSMFSKDGESAYDKAEEIAKYKGLLIIDDLGAEKLTDFVRQITYYILNEREQYQRDIVITSNFSLGEIDAQIDKRISSRIVGMCEVLKFTGKDRRIKEK